MILTGKCKEDFIKYASYNYGEDSRDLAMMRSVMRNALIIEWFDRIGIIINVYYNTYSNGFVQELILNDKILNTDNNYKTRQEATTQAIKKANEIYNEQAK